MRVSMHLAKALLQIYEQSQEVNILDRNQLRKR